MATSDREGLGRATGDALIAAIRRSLPTRGIWMDVELQIRRLLASRDIKRHRAVPEMDRWGPILAGAPRGHVVLPSRALDQSRYEAEAWYEAGYIRQGIDVLDIGCGNGRQAIGLLEKGIAHYVGLDVIRECVDYCSTVFDDDRCEFLHLDVRNGMYNPQGSLLPEAVVLPVADERFDFVVAGSLYTHLERLPVIARYLDETHRVMRDGGYASTSWFLSPPNPVSSHPKRTVFRRTEVESLLSERFEIVEVMGGDSGAYHDQCQIVVRRI